MLAVHYHHGTATAASGSENGQRQHRREQEQGPRSAINLANDPTSFIEKCEVTAGQRCDYEYLRRNLPPGKTQWFVVPGGDTRCLDEASPFGFGVFPPPHDGDAGSAGAPKLLLWFSGGGACFDYATCVETPLASTAVHPETGGYFNYDLAGNPLRAGRWAAVTVGYCSGDAHVGDAVVALASENNSTERRTVRFNGYNNTLSVLDWIKAQPDFAPGSIEIAASGCSAGSLGVQLWSAYLVAEMGVTKLQPDSYIGMMPPGGNAALNLWNDFITYSRNI